MAASSLARRGLRVTVSACSQMITAAGSATALPILRESQPFRSSAAPAAAYPGHQIRGWSPGGALGSVSCRGLSSAPVESKLRVTPAVMLRLQGMQDRHREVCQKLSEAGLSPSELASLGKELADLEAIVKLHTRLLEIKEEIGKMTEMEDDASEDNMMREMAASEREGLEAEAKEVEGTIVMELLPKDKDDKKDVILEVRAGAGGDEAGIFAMDMLQMYRKYSAIKGWRFETLEMTPTSDSSNGCKNASASLSGDNVYSQLKYENGVHRVQRVPQTDTAGRIHTSTATVLVMPEADEVDVVLNESDIKVDVFKASGAGGQHVNTTESAVRMTHIPTGLTVSMQDERSQHKNRAKALKVLRARLYDHEQAKAQAELSVARSVAGTGDRSERIRTYNFKDGRVTDHRVGVTEHGMDAMLAGELLDTFTQALQFQERMQMLESLQDQ